MKPINDKDKLKRSTQPIILKWWKLQISHDHPVPQIGKTGKEVVNLYWNYRHILSIAQGHINIRLMGRLLSIPPYKR